MPLHHAFAEIGERSKAVPADPSGVRATLRNRRLRKLANGMIRANPKLTDKKIFANIFIVFFSFLLFLPGISAVGPVSCSLRFSRVLYETRFQRYRWVRGTAAGVIRLRLFARCYAYRKN